MDKEKKTPKEDERQDYRGVDVNMADGEEDTTCLQEQDTRMMNNNPRNGDGPQPEP